MEVLILRTNFMYQVGFIHAQGRSQDFQKGVVTCTIIYKSPFLRHTFFSY